MSDTIPQKASKNKRNNQLKDDQLGMPHGTACNRLRKQILFELLKKHGENVCFVCNLPIERSEDLSIEHKIPWQYNDIALFWDMDNIAFSHLNCNRQHTTNNLPKRKVGPEGTAWCTGCKTFKNTSFFPKNKSRWNGLNNYCFPCEAKRKKHKKGDNPQSAI